MAASGPSSAPATVASTLDSPPTPPSAQAPAPAPAPAPASAPASAPGSSPASFGIVAPAASPSPSSSYPTGGLPPAGLAHPTATGIPTQSGSPVAPSVIHAGKISSRSQSPLFVDPLQSHPIVPTSQSPTSLLQAQLGKSQSTLVRNSTQKSITTTRSSLSRGHSLQRSLSEVLRRNRNVSPESTRISKDDSSSHFFGSDGLTLGRKDMQGGKSYGDLSMEELQVLSITALKRVNALFKVHSLKPLPNDTLKQVQQSCGVPNLKKKWWVPPWKKEKEREKDLKDRSVLKSHLCKSIDFASVHCDVDRPYGVRRLPVIGFECINFIRAHGLATNGLFRVNGSERRIAQLMAIFDSGPSFGRDVTFSGYTVYDVADFLKKYVRGLPEPLLTSELYPHFLKCLDLPVEGAVRVKALRWLIMLLPPAHVVFFECLLELFSQVAKSSDQNQMTASNLARIFSPNVLRPRGTEKQALEDFQTASFVIEFMIDNWEQFAITGPELRPFELMDSNYLPKRAYSPARKTLAIEAYATSLSTLQVSAGAISPMGTISESPSLSSVGNNRTLARLSADLSFTEETPAELRENRPPIA
ncbi:Rho GTPase activation protein [Zopfochytrium polystomum]|nr:Rho GTPase activation protein [Zopfochytrium polystomum]